MLNTKYRIGRLISYGIVAWLLCVLQNTPGLFAIAGIKPMLVVPFAVSVALYQKETVGGIFGMFAGLLCDFFSTYTFGYYAMALLFFCTVAGMVAQGYMRTSAMNATIFTFATILFIQLVGFFFTILLWSDSSAWTYFLQKILPMCLYTAVTTIPIYWFTGLLYDFWQKKIDSVR